MRNLALVLLGVIGLHVAGCDTAEPLQEARLRFVHTAPQAPVAFVRIQGNTVVDSLEYGERSGYVTVFAAPLQTIVFDEFFVPDGSQYEHIAQITFDIEAGARYTVTLTPEGATQAKDPVN